MIRIAHITDPEFKARVVAALAARRGMSAGMVPEWFELDEADFVDLLNDIRAEDEGSLGGDLGPEDHNESRM